MTSIIPGRRVARLPLLCLRAATVVLCDLAIEYSVSPSFTLWRTTLSELEDCILLFGFDLEATRCEPSTRLGVTGRWIYRTRRPSKLPSFSRFHRRPMVGGTPKLSATLCKVSPLRIR